MGGKTARFNLTVFIRDCLQAENYEAIRRKFAGEMRNIGDVEKRGGRAVYWRATLKRLGASEKFVAEFRNASLTIAYNKIKALRAKTEAETRAIEIPEGLREQDVMRFFGRPPVGGYFLTNVGKFYGVIMLMISGMLRKSEFDTIRVRQRDGRWWVCGIAKASCEREFVSLCDERTWVAWLNVARIELDRRDYPDGLRFGRRLKREYGLTPHDLRRIGASLYAGRGKTVSAALVRGQRGLRHGSIGSVERYLVGIEKN